MPLVRRLLERLRRQANVLGRVLARQPREPRRLLPQRLVVGVEPPEERGQPGDAALDKDESHAGESLEQAVRDHARDVAHAGLAEERVRLPEERGRAAACRVRVDAALPAEVHGHGKADFRRRFPDRVVERVAVGALGAGGHEHLDEIRDRVEAVGWDECLVVNDQRVVLGRLPGRALRTPTESMAEAVMERGPSTIRPDELLSQLVPRLRDKHVDRIIVTTPDGQLVGIVERQAAENALAAQEHKENHND